MDELLQLVIEKLRELEEPTLTQVFDGSLVERLAELPEPDYERFKLQLNAYLIVNGRKIKDLQKLDTLVTAAVERIEQARLELPPTLLSDACPDAPDAGLPLFIPPGWWLHNSGVGKLKENSVRIAAFCDSPVYACSKIIDHERAKTLVKYVAKVNDRWRYIFVEAGAGKKALVKAFKNAGVLVLVENDFVDYLNSFICRNWNAMPTEEKSSLFEEFKTYVSDNIKRFTGKGSKTLGKMGITKDGTRYIAITPEAFRKFAKSAGAHPEQTLRTWQEEGILLPDSEGNYTKVLSLNSVSRRMIVFHDFLEKVQAVDRLETTEEESAANQ